MPEPLSFGRLDLEIVASMDKARGVPERDTPFRVLIMGDFSGRATGGVRERGSDLAERRRHRIDRDDLDEVMGKLKVAINLPFAGKDSEPITLRFSELDDFHPDRLVDRIEFFGKLRDALSRKCGATPNAELPAAIRSRDNRAAASEPDHLLDTLQTQTAASLLDEILEDTPDATSQQGSGKNASEWDLFLREITFPHTAPVESRTQRELQETVNAASGELLRAILHFPDFQNLEAAWRGLHFLVSRVETKDDLQLYLLDCSREELADDLGAPANLSETGLYRVLVGEQGVIPDTIPWAMVAGVYHFGADVADAELLGRIARVAAAAGAPFVAAAEDTLLGSASLARTPDPREWTALPEPQCASRAWDALRKLPEAACVGLVMPRFLLRLPYGADTVPIERFAFEELDAGEFHDQYLWGNPALVVACLLAQAFGDSGWDFRPGVIQEIDNLPLPVVRTAEGPQITPCAEVVLTEQAVEAIMDRGIMPLLSLRNQDVVRLARVQSLSDPPSPLAGPWDR